MKAISFTKREDMAYLLSILLFPTPLESSVPLTETRAGIG